MQLRLLLLMGLGVHHWAITEHLLGALQELLLPSGYLCGIERMAVRQFTQCLALLERFKYNLRLEGGAVFCGRFSSW